MERRAFLDQSPPPGYVAGVGRGATGFTTSADSGPVKFDSQFGSELDNNADPEEGLLGQSTRSLEDDEADRIYEEIDSRMQRRRRAKDTIDGDSLSKAVIPTGTGTIEREFSLFKNDLASVSRQEWETLPEVGDLTRKNKRQRLLDQQSQRTYAAPDMLIANAGSGLRQDASRTGSSVDDTHSFDNSEKLAEIEEWAEKSSLIGDLEKGRLILSSLRKTKPYEAASWISSAHLEESAKNFSQAKSFISKGCTLVPHNEQLWLENIRLHRSSGPKACKAIMSEALRLNSESENLWLAAVDLENTADVVSKRKILMKALQFLPSNPKLWKALIDLEEDSSSRIRLLNRATENCPQEWDIWLTLVNASSYSDAKAVLNRARKQLPTEYKIWVTALKLEERENEEVSVDKLSSMLSKGMKELEKLSSNKSSSEWLEESVTALKEKFEKTSQAIVNCTLKILHSEAGAGNDIFEIANSFEREVPSVASYLFRFVSKSQPHNISNWIKLFSLLKSDHKGLFEVYEEAMQLNQSNELIPLMYAKDKWILSQDVSSAKSILSNAQEKLPSNIDIWAARLKLSLRTSTIDDTLSVSAEALSENLRYSPRAWYKHLHILRYCLSQGIASIDFKEVLKVSKQAIEQFPDNEKICLQRAQILIESKDIKAARETLSMGTRTTNNPLLIWLALADLDLHFSGAARSRSTLDMAVMKLPNAPLLWEAKIKLELQVKDNVIARQMINKALKEFPSSPYIWILHLKNINKPAHRKNAFLDALKNTNNSPEVLTSIGVFLWMEGKFTKAKSWFDRALMSDRTNGDVWGWLYCFQEKYGRKEEVNDLLKNFSDCLDDINRGQIWNSVVKSPANLAVPPSECIKLVSDKLLSTLI